MNDLIICPNCKFQFLNGKRSTRLSNYLHAIFSNVANHIGDITLEQVKEDVMHELGYIEYRANVITGEEKAYRKETKNMTNAEASELCDKTRKWALDFLGLSIPDAEEWKQGMRTHKTFKI